MVTEETLFLGKFSGNAEDLVKIFKTNIYRAKKLAPLYIKYGELFNLRSDLAWAQMCHETGYLTFKGVAKPEWNNFAGIGITGSGAKQKFATEELGVIAHFAHLSWYYYPNHVNAYCSVQYDPRHFGNHPKFTGDTSIKFLNGKWAYPGTTYAQSIAKIANMINVKDSDIINNNKKIDIVIQMGHIGYNAGMTGTKGEQSFNKAVGESLFSKFISSSSPYIIKLMGAFDFGDKKPLETNIFFSIHADGSLNPKARGCSIGYPEKSDNSFARFIQENYLKLSGFPKRKDNYTTGLARYYAWGKGYIKANYYCLLEHGFLTNKIEREWLNSHTNEIADCHYNTINKFLEKR